MTELRDFDAERRRILRRISLLTWALWGLVVVLAVGGGALLAWIFRGVGGLSFVTLWILAALLLVAVPAAMHGVGGWRRRRRKRRGDEQTTEGRNGHGG